ncbi:TonB-dependent receptor [Coralloluteibacterium stylophorae]|uniref:TonB-dependent receptor n=2 Tax=Coralloluteibacterium stylophorae TaxID=1776034 RepID=A0A8J8AWH0_9GAMM|nr:TonB-dependent receptor [Coralloluteibacterium stylophorae]
MCGTSASRRPQVLARAVRLALLAVVAPAGAQSVMGADDDQVTWLDRVEVTATPLAGSTVDADHLPYTVQTATAGDIAAAQTANLTDFLTRRLAGVNGNEVQGSPFQTDITFRGFRASALPGAPQGVSVFLDGVRLNEPFADIVSWDMIPEAAVASLALMPGSNPLYGANTLGGALVFRTKSGLTDPGVSGDIQYGSDERKRIDAAWGWAGADGTHAFAATTLFDEDGWRDLSEGRLGNVFLKAGREGEATDWDVSVLHGRSRLIGNGLLPSWRYTEEGLEEGLYEDDRRAVYSSPDLTRNRNTMVTARLQHRLDARNALNLLAYTRRGTRDTVNGDASEEYEEYVEECEDGFDAGGLPLGDDCDFTAAEAAALLPAVFNTTRMEQRAHGLALNLDQALGAHRLTWGASWDRSRVDYAQFEQPGDFTAEREVIAVPGEEREFFSGVDGESEAVGVFVSDLWTLTADTWLDVSLRWNRAEVENTLSTAEDGERPREAFTYTKLNPSLGITHRLDDGLSVFANASQNTRAPTAIELGCADPEEPCRLPTGLQADPFLEQIVSRTYEVGARWTPTPEQALSVSVYRADNRDDILFLRAPNSQQGYFDNVERTRNQGVDLQYLQRFDAVTLWAGYSYLEATYETGGELLSGERIIELEPGMRIAGLPEHTFKLGLDWQATPALLLGADLQVVSDRVATGNEDGLVANPGGDDDDDEGEADLDDLRHDLATAGYGLLNLRAEWAIDERLSLYARVNNVLDKRYETYAAVAEDLFPGGELVAPHVEPAEEGPSRFVAPGAPRTWQVGLRFDF